jgi:pyrroline-5-carboxylate reductase
MAGAMVEGWRAGGIDFSGVTVIRPSGTPVEGIQTVTDYPANESPRFVMLGFKPQKLDEVAPGLVSHVGTDTILVSMLAGVSAASLRERFPAARAIIRIMPNLPVAQLQGVIAIYSSDFDQLEVVEECKPLTWLGMSPWCDTEDELGVIGAVAAAGVAYVARFAEALGRTAENLGVSPPLARSIAIQTLVGTSDLAKETGLSMPEIARRVASPKGTTEQGLAVLDAADGLQPLVDRTLAAAIRRGRELADEAARN